MNHPVLKMLSVFLVPASFLGVAALLYPRVASFSPAWRELSAYLPAVTTAGGLFLSLHFHRGRAFSVLLLLALYAWCSRYLLANGVVDIATGMLFQYLTLLIPANIALFCFMRERGPFTVAGRMRIVFLAIQAGLVVWMIRAGKSGILELTSRKFLHSPLLDGLALSQQALVLAVGGGILMAIRIARRQSPMEGAFLATLIAVVVSGNRLTTPELPGAFLAAAALALCVGILRDSYNMAFQDELTGIPARRALTEQLQTLGRSYCIAMVDADHFKRFNDTYGHDVGDQVLKMLARKLQGVGGGGRPFRYGGEEFTIVFPRRTAAEVLPHLEELRKGIAAYQLRIRSGDRPRKQEEGKRLRGTRPEGETVSVTVSIGLAQSDEGRNPDEVVKAADRALYRAKQRGRNQVCR